MSVTTVRPQDAEPPLVLALDAGSSSVRALLYDAGARRVEGVEARLDHSIHTDAHGTAEEYPQHLLDAFSQVIDGASANVGSGCVGPGRVALTVGTTCAMRAVLQREPESLPAALWSYKVDRGHPLVGGALSEGGNVFAWLTGLLRLEEPPDLDQQLGKLPPDGHGLTVLPFLLGERSPGWRSDARAAIVGLRASTTPLEVLQAGMEAVAYRCGLVARALRPLLASDYQLIASGGALLRSPYWLQVFADVLDHPITASAEPEGTSRGTAILALKALGKIERLDAIPSALGETCFPDGTRAEIYRAAQERQAQLYRLLLDSSSGSGAS